MQNVWQNSTVTQCSLMNFLRLNRQRAMEQGEMSKVDSKELIHCRESTHCVRQPAIAVFLGGPIAVAGVHILLTDSWTSFHRLWAAERARSKTHQYNIISLVLVFHCSFLSNTWAQNEETSSNQGVIMRFTKHHVCRSCTGWTCFQREGTV